MKIKNLHLVCFSPTQTTLKVLQAIAQGLPVKPIIHDATLHLAEATLPEFDSEDLVLVGAPVYGGRIPAQALPFYGSLKGRNTPAAVIALYGNCRVGDALLELEQLCLAGGLKVIAGASFIGEHSYSSEIAGGRPGKEDLDLAKDFGRLLGAKLSADNFEPVLLPGQRPLAERKAPQPSTWAPFTTDDCIYCGICIENCPVGIINAQDPKLIDAPEKCLRCGSCVKKCPVEAKYFAGEAFQRSMVYLKESCSDLKEPILYI